MDKYEKILQVPACYITREIADGIATRIYALAEEQGHADYVEALRRLAPNLGLSGDEVVRQYADNLAVRQYLFVRKDRSIFISPHGNVQYAGREVLYDEIPMDPQQIVIDIPGPEEKYLNISLTTDLFQFFPLHKVNKILIQGGDRGWVNGLYAELETALAASRKLFRDFVYRWFRWFGWLAFLGLAFLEFRAAELLFQDFNFLTPLTGLASLAIFSLFSVTWYLVFFAGARVLQYLYPYFELQDRLSERRHDLRKLWIVTVVALYGGGIWAAVVTLFG